MNTKIIIPTYILEISHHHPFHCHVQPWAELAKIAANTATQNQTPIQISFMKYELNSELKAKIDQLFQKTPKNSILTVTRPVYFLPLVQDINKAEIYPAQPQVVD